MTSSLDADGELVLCGGSIVVGEVSSIVGKKRTTVVFRKATQARAPEQPARLALRPSAAQSVGPERVADRQPPVDHLAVLHVLGPQRAAAGGQRGGDDEAVVNVITVPF